MVGQLPAAVGSPSTPATSVGLTLLTKGAPLAVLMVGSSSAKHHSFDSAALSHSASFTGGRLFTCSSWRQAHGGHHVHVDLRLVGVQPALPSCWAPQQPKERRHPVRRVELALLVFFCKRAEKLLREDGGGRPSRSICWSPWRQRPWLDPVDCPYPPGVMWFKVCGALSR